ncbi:hypothetical protein BDA99DRAFT_544160 [Phascolomyces articulosus]|uniref:Uncharacterized protein n=1 Tax=Phascolomyces articulosus TaxID=60185 RepID=A0AAD5JKV2_9FUNG|nr:hypothetical protein BDA99DRAFT_544160 [Phascolomyces articulosus]
MTNNNFDEELKSFDQLEQQGKEQKFDLKALWDQYKGESEEDFEAFQEHAEVLCNAAADRNQTTTNKKVHLNNEENKTTVSDRNSNRSGRNFTEPAILYYVINRDDDGETEGVKSSKVVKATAGTRLYMKYKEKIKELSYEMHALFQAQIVILFPPLTYDNKTVGASVSTNTVIGTKAAIQEYLMDLRKAWLIKVNRADATLNVTTENIVTENEPDQAKYDEVITSREKNWISSKRKLRIYEERVPCQDIGKAHKDRSFSHIAVSDWPNQYDFGQPKGMKPEVTKYTLERILLKRDFSFVWLKETDVLEKRMMEWEIYCLCFIHMSNRSMWDVDILKNSSCHL